MLGPSGNRINEFMSDLIGHDLLNEVGGLGVPHPGPFSANREKGVLVGDFVQRLHLQPDPVHQPD